MGSPGASPPAADNVASRLSELIWHDLESGRYTIDFGFWLTLAPGSILELGAGTGRVSLALARSGARVTAIDRDPALLEELRYRADALHVGVETTVADARTFDLGTRFDHVIAPLAFVQVLDGRGDRVATMEASLRHLEPEGRLWLAIHPDLDDAVIDPDQPPPPDWVGTYETQVVKTWRTRDRLVVRRRRIDRTIDLVSHAEIVYSDVPELEQEAEEAGLTLTKRVALPEDDWYSPSEVLSFKAR
jgi:SAM-dependent methyltransferase